MWHEHRVATAGWEGVRKCMWWLGRCGVSAARPRVGVQVAEETSCEHGGAWSGCFQVEVDA